MHANGIIPGAMRRVLVTGGGGFVAPHAVEAFLKAGWEVRLAFRAPPAGTYNARVERVAAGDFLSTHWEPLLEGVDVVVHLAARVHRPADTGDDSHYIEQNVRVTERLVSAAAASGVSRFVFLSSVKACAESTSISETLSEASPCRPSDPYGVSKLMAEARIREICKSSAMDFVILRPPLVYGRGVRANFLALIKLVRSGLPLPLGAVSNLRSFLSVGNLADVLVRCSTHPGGTNGTFFVSDGEDVSTPELMRRIAAAFGARLRLFSVPEPLLKRLFVIAGRREQFERLCGSLRVDGGKACRQLDWSPPYSLDEGLRSIRSSEG